MEIKMESSGIISNQRHIRGKLLPRWQFISQGATPAAHLFYIQLALEGGCKWIQLRLKNQSLDQVLKVGRIARQFCDQYQATFILNDHLSLVREMGADGVHLGLQDASIQMARQVLGEAFIVGGTANTAKQVRMRVNQGADYIGLGPYRYTTTKQALSPVLGLAGYQQILETTIGRARAAKSRYYFPPIYAIGGILDVDIAAIFKTGVQGVAISGWLSRQVDLAAVESESEGQLQPQKITEFYRRWKEKNACEAAQVLDRIAAFGNTVKASD